MFITWPTSISALGELHFEEKLFTAAGATKERGHSFCMMGQIGILFTHIEFVKIYQAVFRIFPHGFHIILQFNELHLEIIRTVFHYQIKGLSKQLQFYLIFSEICKSVCKLITQVLYTSFIVSAIQIRKFQFPCCKTSEMRQMLLYLTEPEKVQFLFKSTNMLKHLIHKLAFFL